MPRTVGQALFFLVQKTVLKLSGHCSVDVHHRTLTKLSEQSIARVLPSDGHSLYRMPVTELCLSCCQHTLLITYMYVYRIVYLVKASNCTPSHQHALTDLELRTGLSYDLRDDDDDDDDDDSGMIRSEQSM